jgi:hypothetical protein
MLASVALSLALAAPAFGSVVGTGLPAWACAPEGSGSAARGLAGRDGVVREKDLGQVAQDLPARAKGKAPAGFSVTVPVYFHVITDGSLGALSGADIRSQIRVLNVTFGGGEGGDDTGFAFALAGVTRTDSATWFYLNGKGAEADMKQTLKQGGNNALNVYSNSGAGFLGWAYYPSIVDSPQAYLDGIVLNWESLPHVSDTFLDRYDEGETLTHEAGHWLNLAHTFDGGCNKGDFVDDTPAQKTPTGGCPEGKDTCRAPGLDPIHNYMDYSYDDCYTEFTPGQTQRMRDAWLLYRAPA